MMTASPAAGGTPHVIYATIYPPAPEERAETFITRELVREYLRVGRDWRLSVVIGSAHASALEAAAGVMEEFPAVPTKFIHLGTPHAGVRREEISFCKEQLPRRLMDEEFDWLLFMDADVWTPLAKVPEWIGTVGAEKGRRFVKIKYSLRDKLVSPHHTLGAYFHHKALLARMRYWEHVFPKDADGRRLGAPDCYLHDYLEGNGCQKIVPERLTTYHFLNREDAHLYRSGELSLKCGARGEVASGAAAREAMAGTSDRPAEAKPQLVSAIMVTGKSAERECLADVAVAAFTEQTHPEKELIIVNHGGRPLKVEHPDVHEVIVPCGCRVTLGDLRNIGLSAAAGQWAIQWDDDDWHGPTRIAEQLAYAELGAAVLLRRQVRYNFETGTAWVKDAAGGIEGTILHRSDVAFRYPSLRKGEDTAFLRNFETRLVIENDPGIYVRFFHGANTWDERHIMREFAGRSNEMHLSAPAREVLFEKVLPRYSRRVGCRMARRSSAPTRCVPPAFSPAAPGAASFDAATREISIADLPEHATSMRAFRQPAGGPEELAGVSVGTSASVSSFSPLVAGVSYSVWVTGHNSRGDGPASNKITFTA